MLTERAIAELVRDGADDRHREGGLASPASTGGWSPYALRGRLDSAPTSRISAPAATNRDGLLQRRRDDLVDRRGPASASPSPENESGVTLTMPISVGPLAPRQLAVPSRLLAGVRSSMPRTAPTR